MSGAARTASEKMWATHEMRRFEDGDALLFIDRLMLHERTGAVALTVMIEDGRTVRDPGSVFATVDHIVFNPTRRQHLSQLQANAADRDQCLRPARHGP